MSVVDLVLYDNSLYMQLVISYSVLKNFHFLLIFFLLLLLVNLLSTISLYVICFPRRETV